MTKKSDELKISSPHRLPVNFVIECMTNNQRNTDVKQFLERPFLHIPRISRVFKDAAILV